MLRARSRNGSPGSGDVCWKKFEFDHVVEREREFGTFSWGCELTSEFQIHEGQRISFLRQKNNRAIVSRKRREIVILSEK